MEIESGLQAFGVQAGEEIDGVGKECLVPGVAAPAKVVVGLVDFAQSGELLFADMPTHIDDKDVQGNVVFMEAFDELVEFLVGVVPVARPPGAEGEARRKGNAAGNFDVIAQSPAVVVSVTEEVQVLPCPAGLSITHGQGLFSPSLKLKSAESNRGRVESSTIAQPEREIRPGSMGSLVVEPTAPSSVRVVPSRFSASCCPGCQTTVWPSTVSAMERLSAVKRPPPV
jgi:hypothetical protein